MLCLQTGCQRGPVEPAVSPKVTILAAASLRECVEELVAESGLAGSADFQISTGASSGLAQQIQSGAPADLFLSANQEWAQAVTDRFPESRKKIVAGNTLVVVVPAASALKLESLAGLEGIAALRIGIAGPEVPAGQYSRQALEKAGILKSLIDEKRLVIGQDVRQVLRWVELGEVDAGLVYRTDPGAAPAVKTVLEIDPKSHQPIEYWLVLMDSEAGVNETARKMFEFVGTDPARKVLERHGFLLPK